MSASGWATGGGNSPALERSAVWLGSKPAEGTYVIMAQGATFYYFVFFLVIMPLLGIVETPRKTAELDHGVGAAEAQGERGGRGAGERRRRRRRHKG